MSLVAVLFVLAVTLLFLKYMARKLYTPYKLSDYSFLSARGILEDERDGNRSNILQQPTVHLSLVIPAFNEEKRICKMLTETITFLRDKQAKDPEYTFELIVVDDGSRDTTVSVVTSYMQEHDPDNSILRLLPLMVNRGKGFAVKQGVLRSRGKYILMVDADGATQFDALKKLEAELKTDSNNHGMAIGSRAHMESQDVVVKRKWYRNLLMNGFHFCVKYIAQIYDIRDTQCGFKLFTRETARLLFLNLHIDRWCMDIDLLRIAKHFNIPIAEVPVTWTDVEGSKMTLRGMVNMGIDLLFIRLFYLLRFWTIEDSPKFQ